MRVRRGFLCWLGGALGIDLKMVMGLKHGISQVCRVNAVAVNGTRFITQSSI